MFSEKTFDFLTENCFRDSKEWFLEHKGEYNENVLKPLVELTEALTPVMEKIDPSIVTIPKINKVISRIYRDTRYSKNKRIFRESAWLSFKKDKKEFPHYPEFFIVFTPEQFLYGCGYYYTIPETSKMIRELALANDPFFMKALKSYENQNAFKLDGEKYKRSKAPDSPENIREWTDRKTISAVKYSSDFSVLFSEKFPEILSEEFLKIKPVYDFFVYAETKARGIIK